MKIKRGKGRIQAPKLESLKQINTNAAGVDVGATELYVCVPEDRDPEPVRVFGTFTYELNKYCSVVEAVWRHQRGPGIDRHLLGSALRSAGGGGV
jgi:hypothetical protein